MKATPLFFALCLAAFTTGQVHGVTLIESGKARAMIVIPDNPSPAAKRALTMLQSHLQQITGITLPVTTESKVATEPSEQQPFILLGEGRLANQLGFNTEGLGAGGMLAEAKGNVVALIGTDTHTLPDYWGTLYATTRFLEQIGVRYLWPGESGKVMPHVRTLEVKDFKVRLTPALAQRHVRSGGYNPRVQVGLDRLHLAKEDFEKGLRDSMRTAGDTCDWFQWQGLGGTLNIVGGHAFDLWWKKHGAEHPEWFALQHDGSRGDGSRFCKSNPELIAEVARVKIEELSRNPQLLGVSICPNDGSSRATFCTCPKCEALDAKTDRRVKLWSRVGKQEDHFDHVPLTDRMVYFWNGIAEQVAKVHPDKLLTVDAYSVYASPPIERKLHPNLVVRYAALDYDVEQDRLEGLRDWDAWAKAAKRIYFRSNLMLAGRRTGMPLIYVHRFAEDFRHLAATGMMGTDLDSCTSNWATQGLNYYVVSRLHFDPTQDVDALIDDYCRTGFGPAGKTMRRYFDRLESVFSAMAKGENHDDASGFSDEVLAQLQTFITQAKAEAGDDPAALKRVEFVALGAKWTDIETHAHRLLAAPAKNDPAEVKRVLDERYAFMREVFQKEPLALNVTAISFGEDGIWSRLRYQFPK